MNILKPVLGPRHTQYYNGIIHLYNNIIITERGQQYSVSVEMSNLNRVPASLSSLRLGFLCNLIYFVCRNMHLHVKNMFWMVLIILKLILTSVYDKYFNSDIPYTLYTAFITTNNQEGDKNTFIIMSSVFKTIF